jgi:ornithine carbamoyltransferase
MGMDVRIAAPKALWPSGEIQAHAQRMAANTGARLTLDDQPRRALAGADFVYTDVWVSMGEPDSVWAERIEQLSPFQVNAAAMAATGNPRAHFMHCLPAFHDLHTEIGRQVHERFGLEAMEVTDEVFESDASIVFTQAENRMHTIKAILVATLG